MTCSDLLGSVHHKHDLWVKWLHCLVKCSLENWICYCVYTIFSFLGFRILGSTKFINKLLLACICIIADRVNHWQCWSLWSYILLHASVSDLTLEHYIEKASTEQYIRHCPSLLYEGYFYLMNTLTDDWIVHCPLPMASFMELAVH